MRIVHSQSLPLLTAAYLADNVDKNRLRNSLPESLIMAPLSPVDTTDDGDSSGGPSSSLNDNTASASSAMSKRTHALLELLSSERAYASDLAFIKDIHIPLALGQQFPSNPNTGGLSSSSSSGSSSRAISVASSSSGSSTAGPPMTKEDVKIIFNNVPDLALFSDFFSERLEEALGSVLEGGTGQDWVGALFLEMIPLLEPPYRKYITRHPTALEHLNGLQKTPALDAYLEHSRTLASSITHAWDLPSLLIKPVQQLLRYSLLLTAIIDGTPDGHPDKENLIKAKASMEDATRGVNEGRRRREVIKEVLTGGKNTPDSSTTSFNSAASGLKPKKWFAVGFSASVELGKGLQHATKSREGADGNEEKHQVENMEAELKRCETFMRRFAKETADWTRKMKYIMTSLYAWAEAFGQVIGISSDSVSEAFDAFKMVLRAQIIPVCEDLETTVYERLLPPLSLLVDSMNVPLKLLEAMHTLEPLHYGLLNLDVSKARPPPSLLEASQAYVALRGQLFAEFPQYLGLLHKGIAASIVQLNTWQTTFYKDAHIHWGELWDALRVEEDPSISCAPETMQVWWERFSILEEALGELGILRKPKVSAPSAIGITRQKHHTPRPPLLSHSTTRPMPSSSHSTRRPIQRARSHSPAIIEEDFQYLGALIRDTPENVTRKSPRSSSQHRGHGRSRSRSRSRPVTPHIQSYPTYPTSPLLITTNSSDSSHSQGPYSSPVLYACKAIAAFHLGRHALYQGYGFHTLEVGTRLGIIEERGHPSTHPSLPLNVDGSEDCLLLAVDKCWNQGWALASFLVPVD